MVQNTSQPSWYLNAENALKLDQDLMGEEYRYTLAQLMELAGLSCAQATHDFIEKELNLLPSQTRILTVCGPGNNGGDGLVAARNLKLFGYASTIFYPKETTNQHYNDLLTQAEKCKVGRLEALPEEKSQIVQDYDIVVDAIFGFSFQATGEIREPFGSAISKLNGAGVPIVSIDIPSGWHVEQGYQGKGFQSPACLISLTAPKHSASTFSGAAHYLGGRFMPEDLLSKYNCRPPIAYQGSNQFLRLS